MDDFLKAIGVIVVMAIVLAGLGLVMAFPCKWAWNATMPYLFGLKEISWGQAFALNFLAGCFFKSSASSSAS